MKEFRYNPKFFYIVKTFLFKNIKKIKILFKFLIFFKLTYQKTILKQNCRELEVIHNSLDLLIKIVYNKIKLGGGYVFDGPMEKSFK